jgi:hypothetical protein
MEHLNLEGLDRDTGSLRTKLLGAALGLVGGLLFGGIVLPSRLLTAPLTAVATAVAAVLVEHWLESDERTSFVPVRSAWVGGAVGLAAGAALGLLAGAGYALLALVQGATPLVALQGLFTAVEIGAISGLAGLVAGLCLGVLKARE